MNDEWRKMGEQAAMICLIYYSGIRLWRTNHREITQGNPSPVEFESDAF
jgi:hypothetical protein